MHGLAALNKSLFDGDMKLPVDFIVGVDTSHGQVDVIKTLFEEIFILFIGDIPLHLLAELIKSPLLEVEQIEHFKLKKFELLQLVNQTITGHFEMFFKIHPLLHQLVDLFIELVGFYQLAFVIAVFVCALGADDDVLLLKAGQTSTHKSCLFVVL
jgi:hypothetical protein